MRGPLKRYEYARYAQDQQLKNLAGVIRVHRQTHAHKLLQQACAMALKLGDIAPVLARFTVPLPAA